MSRRNGPQQTFEELIGVGSGSGTTALATIGSYVAVGCVRDLGLDDMLSASSLGQFSLQIKVTYERKKLPYGLSMLEQLVQKYPWI